MPRIKEWIDSNVTLKEGVERRDEVMSSFSHALGLLAAVVSTVFLLIQARGSVRAMVVSVIYGVTMCGVFASSAIYHWLRPSTAKRLFRLLDHAAIYLLIAGTYTPYAAAMGLAGNQVLYYIWGLCFLGLIINVVLWDRLVLLHISVYLLMGWLLIFFFDDLMASASIDQVRWMLIGGGSYTIGVFFYMYRKLPHNHFLWHLFVIAGAAGLHVGIARYAIPSII